MTANSASSRARHTRLEPGIPVGYSLNSALVWFIGQIINVAVPVAFPPQNLLIALVGTIVLALIVLILPLRRAACLRPGDAFRNARGVDHARHQARSGVGTPRVLGRSPLRRRRSTHLTGADDGVA